MKIVLEVNGEEYKINLDKGIDISIPISAKVSGPSCFGAEEPKFTPMQGDGWIARVSMGGSVNAFDVTFNPHGNGTHTEGPGHISNEYISIQEEHKDSHVLANLITVTPSKINGDDVITKENLAEVQWSSNGAKGLIVRTLPNLEEKRRKNYSQTNPPYLSVEAMAYIVDKNVEHLLLDLPSVDKEDDGGHVVNHKKFWNWPTFERRRHCTITEMIYVPNKVSDGLYLLNMQRAAFDLDCAPSRPIIFQVKKFNYE